MSLASDDLRETLRTLHHCSVNDCSVDDSSANSPGSAYPSIQTFGSFSISPPRMFGKLSALVDRRRWTVLVRVEECPR